MDISESAEALKEERTSNDKGKAKQLPGDIKPRDAFIAVMGVTGSGKSTFVNKCSGRDAVVVGHGLNSETQEIDVVTFEHHGVSIHLIDTPGFDDTTRTDTDILVMIASYLSYLYESGRKLDGLIYMSPITDRRMSGSAVKNLNIFSKLVGDGALSKVVLVTSMWDVVDDRSVAQEREKQLRDVFWRPLMEKGSQVCRLGYGRQPALHVLDVLLQGAEPDGTILQIQHELAVDMKTLDQTEAGQQLSKEIQKLQEGFRRNLDEMKRELNDAIAAKDANMEQRLRTEQALFERKLSQAEDERKALRVDFERMVREKEAVNASLIRQLNIERREKAVLIEELIPELEDLRTQVQQNKDYRTTKSPDIRESRGRSDADQSSIERLEGELEKVQKDLAEKEARMKDMRGFVIDVLTDTISNPPPPYTQSTMSHEPSGFAGRQTPSRRAPSITSDEATKTGQFRSYLARNENQRSQRGPENTLESNVRAARSNRTRTNLRVMHEERRKLREELYQSSLLSFEQDEDSEKPSNPILQRGSSEVREVCTLCTRYQFPTIERRKLQYLLSHTLTAMAEDTLISADWLFYQTYLLRNATLAVYHNCRRLQTAELAGAWFSMLVLQPPPNDRTGVINLNRVYIEDIREVVEQLSSFIIGLQVLISIPRYHVGRSSASILTNPYKKVHEVYRRIFYQLGLEDFLSLDVDQYNMDTELVSIWNRDIFAQWWCATRALDAGLVAYESGHVSNSQQTSRINLSSNIPQLGTLKLQDTPQSPGHPESLQFVSRGLKCLASFFQRHPVWILALGEASNDLYLATDIETFADVWGPVWKVADQSQPGSIAKYNVRGGSIIPWPCDPDVHPKLRPNERLCHWKSNDEYIHPHDEGSTNVDSSASSSDSDETREDSVQAASFSGNEILIIGARQDHRLQFYPCHCSLRAIKQDLKNAGRLDRIIASKSYRYIDSRQRSLVGGSHGIQIGTATTSKDESQKPYKVGLLDRWENEPCSRDPRDFEDMWGVAVSLCTMNARRVRLIKLFAEESVVTLLRSFPWSESYQRDSFLDAIRSADPFALGDLWEDNPDWQTSLGNAILICLRILFKTGYNENRDEFHMLWLPPGCRDPRRVTFKPSDHRWTNFLKDTTDSMTVAVIIEDRLGYGPCRGHEREWFKYPSALETAICVNRDISPAEKLTRSRDTDDEYSYIPRRYDGRWRITWGVSGVEPGVKFWTGPQNRVSTIRPLNSRHLLLQMDTVKREKLQKLVGLKPAEHWKGHWEYTDVELDGDGDRPIPVHIN